MNEKSQKYIKEFVAQRVSELLVENKITNKKALSHLIGYNEHLVSDLLNKNRNPYVVSIYDLCEFFGITLEDFFRIDYSNDKSSAALMKLLTDQYEPKELSILYDVLSRVDKERLMSMLLTYSDYHKSKCEDENTKG